MFPIRDSIPSRTVPVVTRGLILINAIIFVLQIGLPRETVEQLFYLFGLVPARFTHPQWAASVGFPIGSYWPVLTHQFLHGGFLHVLLNMWTLWIFGDNVEDRMGALRFTIFYLLCGAIAGGTHVLINPDSTIPSVGASGAIAGVLGAYLLFFPTSRLVVLFPIFFFPFFFELPAGFYLVLWFLGQLFSGTAAVSTAARAGEQVGGIAWWAHIGGFVAGMILCWVFRSRPAPRQLQPDEHALEWAWQPRQR